jgi:hydrogenase maturation protein HypF
MKSTLALAWAGRAVVSPHIGDMGTPRSLEVFEQVAGDLQRLYGVRAESLVCDAHPGYTTARWALRSGLPVRRVFHHHAHASALVGEHTDGGGPWLVFTWDGVGYGEDRTLWGGEALLGAPGRWRRVGSLRTFRLPGGERAGREPWRSAAAVCWACDEPWPGLPADAAVARAAWAKGLNAPETSAAGRLFDAAAALTGLVQRATFEGEGPMRLEAAARGDTPGPDLPVRRDDGLWRIDWQPLVRWLLDSRVSVGERAAGFHAALARALVAQALAVRRETPVARVGLCGGVFQNRLLAEHTSALLAAHDFAPHLPRQLPANDAAISFGQAVEHAVLAGSD